MRTIAHWLDPLHGSSRQAITPTLLKPMKSARRRGNTRRFSSQTVLLPLLVESNLALDLATYSALECTEPVRHLGS